MIRLKSEYRRRMTASVKSSAVASVRALSSLSAALSLSLLSLMLSTASAAEPIAADQAGYRKTVAPFFKAYCDKCHVGEKAEAEFRLSAEALPNQFGDPGARAKWREVVNVINSHEMPPEKEPQPSAKEAAAVVDWITEQAIRAELHLRERNIVMRRLTRDEYANTVRELFGVEFDSSVFPQDPPTGGFDNNGGALTISPLHIELYLAAAREILDRALVEGDRPAAIKWRFSPKAGPADRTRVRLDSKNNPLVNGNNNQQEGDWVVIHHNSWDKNVGARDFRVPTAGNYLIRLHAAGRTPGRDKAVETAERQLEKRRQEQDEKNPKGKEWSQRGYERDLEHFKTDRMYDYGPPRAKLVLQLGPQPRTLAEFDITGTPEHPQTLEFPARFTTESAGITWEYAYAIPPVLENFWLQRRDDFARPELMIDWFEVEGPVYDAWPPSSHTRILYEAPAQAGDEQRVARNVLARFMRKAWRRPIAPAEIDSKLKLFTAARAEKSYVEAIKAPLTAVLMSPHFLYLEEPAPASAGNRPVMLNSHQLAARLSYLIWSNMPDDDLSRAADRDVLRDPKSLQEQADRMLKDRRSDEFVRNFAGQWLSLREIGANPPAADLFPQYDRHLETSMAAESEMYFREFLRNDLDIRKMLRSDFVVINERLARFYGIPNVRGDEFRRTPVPEGVHRGGIVTQASILTITSNGTRTSPVKRGTWIMKTLLGTDPGLPVANAGEIAPKVPGIDKATVRKRLEIHRELPQCARCHSKIDPLGFALENYNAAGEWREQEGFGYKGRIERNDPKIDASSKMPDGTEINGVEGLQTSLLAKEDLFLAALMSKLLTYALGRELGLADQPTVKAVVADLKRNNYTLRAALKSIVASEAFRTK
jgi:hypothetical protein